MTQDEIIEMAVQAGMAKEIAEVNIDIVEAFAKLVAAKEREKFCAVLRQLHDSYSLASDPSGIRARGQA
jgi:hypothetical protein